MINREKPAKTLTAAQFAISQGLHLKHSYALIAKLGRRISRKEDGNWYIDQKELLKNGYVVQTDMFEVY